MDMQPRIALALIALLLAHCTSEAKTSTAPPRTVVLELFTSQGCSSCPPADALLSEIQREDFGGRTVIPLAYHVDYWNYLGWSDPFSSPAWSQRQREYARRIPKSQVYTPQLVVNGTTQLVGNARPHVRAEIARQLKEADRGSVTIDQIARRDGQLHVTLRARVDRGSARVMVALYENGIRTPVTRGENARKKLVNDGIVRWLGSAGDAGVTEKAMTISIPLDRQWKSINIAAFLQDPRTFAIYGAADSRATSAATRKSSLTPRTPSF